MMKLIVKWLLFSGALILTLGGCSTQNSSKIEELSTSKTIQTEQKTITKEGKDKDIEMLTNLFSKQALLDNMIGNIGYNITPEMTSDNAGVISEYSDFFLEKMYTTTMSVYEKAVIDIKDAGFKEKEEREFIEANQAYDQVLEEGRTILLQLTKENAAEIATEYATWGEANDIPKLGMKQGEALGKMINTKYKEESDAAEVVGEALQRSMEKYGDPADYQLQYGAEPAQSEIKKVFDALEK